MKTLSPATLLLLTLAAPSVALADSISMPSSYVKDVGDEYVFVMLVGRCVESKSEAKKATKTAKKHRRSGCLRNELGEVYEYSGLYERGSAVPLWSVEWFSRSVDVSSDGRYLVRHGGWAMSVGSLGIAFYDRGTLLRRYRINDLVFDYSKLGHTASHFFWRTHRILDDEAKRFYLETHSDNDYVFDITNGEIIVKSGPQPPSYEVEVRFEDDRIQRLTELRICGGEHYDYDVERHGRDAEHLIVRARFETEEPYHYLEFGLGSLINSPLVRLPSSDEDLRFEFEDRDETLVLLVKREKPSFVLCGRDEEESEQRLRLSEVISLQISEIQGGQLSTRTEYFVELTSTTGVTQSLSNFTVCEGAQGTFLADRSPGFEFTMFYLPIRWSDDFANERLVPFRDVREVRVDEPEGDTRRWEIRKPNGQFETFNVSYDLAESAYCGVNPRGQTEQYSLVDIRRVVMSRSVTPSTR